MGPRCTARIFHTTRDAPPRRDGDPELVAARVELDRRCQSLRGRPDGRETGPSIERVRPTDRNVTSDSKLFSPDLETYYWCPTF